MFKRLDKETIDLIISLRTRGFTVEKVASVLGVGRSSVMRYSTPGFYRDKSEKRRQRRRRSQVFTTINGKTSSYKVDNKRPRPDNCELCNKAPLKLQWHHWNDKDLSKGIWVCFRCHMFCEAIEKGLGAEHVLKYLFLKEEVAGSNRQVKSMDIIT